MANKNSNNRKKKMLEIVEAATTKGSSNNTMQNQVNNYKTRAEAAGVKKDSRNAVEKFLNLPEDQNVLFDIFEILGRPQQALFRGIESMQEGGDFLEGAKEGWTGEEKTNFGDILRNAGVDDTPLFTGPLSGEERSLADILGFAGDVFIDPMDAPLIPVKAVSTAAKGAKAIDTATDTVKAIDKATDALKTVDKVADTAEKAYKLKSGNDLVFGAVGKAIKGTGKVADKGISKILGVSDAKTMERLAKAGEDISQFSGKLDKYNDLKKSLGRFTDYKGTAAGDLLNKTGRFDDSTRMIEAEGQQIIDDLRKGYGDYASKSLGRAATDKDIDNISSEVQNLISLKYAPEVDAKKFLDDALTNGKNVFKSTDREVNKVKQALEGFKSKHNLTDDALNIKVGHDGNKATLTITTKGKGASKKLVDITKNNAFSKELSDIRLTNITKYSPETNSIRRHLENKYKRDADFRQIVDNSEKAYKQIANSISEFSGNNIDFNDMLRKGYVRNTVTDEAMEDLNKAKKLNMDLGMKEGTIGSKQTFTGKSNLNNAHEANIQFKKKMESREKSTIKKQENLKARLHANDVENTKQQIEGIKEARSTAEKNINENLAKYQGKQNKVIEKYQKQQYRIDNIDKIIDDAVIKKATNLVNDKVTESLITHAERYNKYATEVANLEKRLSKKGLTQAEINSTVKKLGHNLTELDKATKALSIQKAKVMGAADKKFIDRAGELANKMANNVADASQRASKYSGEATKLDSKIKSLNEGYEATKHSLENAQKNLELHLNKLENMSAEEISKGDKFYLDGIEHLQKEIDVLGSLKVKNLYKEDFLAGIGDFTKFTTKESKNLNAYREVLLSSGLHDENVMKFIPKGQNAGKIPYDKVRIDQKEFKRMKSYLDNYKNFLPEDANAIKELKQMASNSGAIIMDKDAYNLLKLSTNTEELHPLLNMLDSYNNLFKKAKTITPGTQLRNMTGNATNMWLSGVPMKDIVSNYSKAGKITKSDYILDLMKKSADNTLNAAEKADYNIIKKYVQGGFLDSSKDIQDIGKLWEQASKSDAGKSAFKKAWDDMFKLSASANTFVDNRNRMALLMYAEKNPKYLSRINAKDSIDAVKKVLFDPSNLSPFEQNVVKKVIPFYTFAKQNLVFQANNIMNNSTRYKRLFKTFNATYDAAGKDSYNQYQKENMEIPMFKSKDGNLVSLKANLPTGDFGEFLENPLSKVINMSSPLIKTPLEKVTGVDTYTGKEKYYSSDNAAYNRLEDLTKLLGLDTVTTSQLNKINNIIEDASNDKESLKIISDLMPSVIRYTDKEKVANSKAYTELEEYQKLFKQLKKEGIDIPTIKQLSTSSSRNLNNLKNKRSKRNRSY